jgi:hypothetical protein
MRNIVNLIREDIPTDLMTFGEVEEKYKIKYHTLYKYTKQVFEIPVYTKGGLRVSEQDIKNWLAGGFIPARG